MEERSSTEETEETEEMWRQRNHRKKRGKSETKGVFRFIVYVNMISPLVIVV